MISEANHKVGSGEWGVESGKHYSLFTSPYSLPPTAEGARI